MKGLPEPVEYMVVAADIRIPPEPDAPLNEKEIGRAMTRLQIEPTEELHVVLRKHIPTMFATLHAVATGKKLARTVTVRRVDYDAPVEEWEGVAFNVPLDGTPEEINAAVEKAVSGWDMVRAKPPVIRPEDN